MLQFFIKNKEKKDDILFMKSSRKTLNIALVAAIFLLSLYYSTRNASVPYINNLIYIPLILAGYLISVSAAVFLAIISAFVVFLTAGLLDGSKILGLSIQSLSFFIVAIISGALSNLLRAKALDATITKNRLSSLNKVSSNFLASLEPVAVFDQLTREARKLLKTEGSILIRVLPDGEVRVLAEENASDFCTQNNLSKILKPALEKGDSTPAVVEINREEIKSDFVKALIVPVLNSEYLILLERSNRPFTGDELRLIQDFLDEAHIALTGASYFSIKEKQSKIISAVSEINKAASSLKETTEVVELSLKRIMEVTGANAGVFLGYKHDKLTVLATEVDSSFNASNLETVMEKTILSESELLEQQPLVFKVHENTHPGFLALLKETKYRNGIYLPVKIENKPAGGIVLLFREWPQIEEIELLQLLSSELSMILYNSKLLSHIKNLTLKTVESIAAAIDATSEYDKGHSLKVAKYATLIAKEMELSFREVREIQFAALLHDMGKIFIDENVINAPRRLTEAELSKIRKLPEYSSKIFKKINFFENIIPLIYHHKERYDGSGYPAGLRGEDIPLGSRIIHVAESFVAMTSERPHRKAMTVTEAVNEIVSNAGTQFDPSVVEAFMKVIKREYPTLFMNIGAINI